MSTKTTTVTTVRACNCGCGTPTRKAGSLYAPGHDARHAGLVARDVIATGNNALLSQALPTLALQKKAAAMVARKAAKPATAVKAERKAGPVVSLAAEPVKVGRWTYPARHFGGDLQRNTKRDGSGEWVAV